MPDTPKPDSELIAYLDGELDGAAARAVEARLARDPAARAAAQAYKKTFDLLAALPQPTAKPDFATRTLTRLSQVKSGKEKGKTEEWTLRTWRRPVLVLSSFFLFTFAFLLSLGVGPRSPAAKDDALQFSDLRVIEHLPLYLGADDLAFVRRLDDPALFAPGNAAGPPPDAPPADRDKLTALFKSYPPARQQQLRWLDQEFHDLPDAERSRLGRVLEGYAVWLDRLPDADRRTVLAAPTADARVEAVREELTKGQRDALSAAVRKRLSQTPAAGRPAVLDEWRAVDQARREEWHLARRQWEKVAHPGRKPWPFDQPELARQVDEFVRAAFKADVVFRPGPVLKQPDFPAACRLTYQEYIDLKVKHLAAVETGNWFIYGLQVYRLAERHPYLPPPVGKPPVTDPKQVESKRTNLVESARNRGKWPDFALSVVDNFRRAKKPAPVPKGLGPGKREEFDEPLRAFIDQALVPGLTADERTRLDGLEGKWPEYPQEVVKLAKKHDYPVPGVTLPGKPSEWARYYAIRP